MEAKSEEIAAYRFHLKLSRMHHKAYYYNLEAGSYFLAFIQFQMYTFESLCVEYHRRHIAQTDWYRRTKGGRK